MSKFSSQSLKTKSPIQTTSVATETYEGAPAVGLDLKSELFLLAVTNLVSENTFYESASSRDNRFSSLVQKATAEDPDFVENLVPFIRNTANLRSCAVVMAAEYCFAKGPHRRQVVNSAMSRADDISEFVGYWFKVTGGRTFPGGVQRGLSDAVKRLYTPYSIMKYDSANSSIRMGDVLNLTHVELPQLGKYIIDRRFKNDFSELPVQVAAREVLMSVIPDLRRDYAKRHPDILKEAGVTWEFLSSWLPGGMDAEAWELAIPNMGYMALLRNLRNFEDANISVPSRNSVNSLISDPEEVARSRQMPFRFFSAYKNTGTDAYRVAITDALEASTKNVPEFPGSTLILIDISGSMSQTLSMKSKVARYEVGALFGASLMGKNFGKSRVVLFGTRNRDVTPDHRTSPLKFVEEVARIHTSGVLDHGTEALVAINDQYQGEDRLVIFSDMQIHPYVTRHTPGWNYYNSMAKFTMPEFKFVHSFDLAGYGRYPSDLAGDKVFMYGGFTDTTMSIMNLIEQGKSQDWSSIVSKAPWKPTLTL